MNNRRYLIEKKDSKLRNVLEIIKSINPKYLLTLDSPKILWNNKKRLKNSVINNPFLLDYVPEEILLEELKMKSLPENGIIMSALEKGYKLGNSSAEIFHGDYSKTIIIENFRKSGVLPRYITKNVENDSEFQNEIIKMAIEQGYVYESYNPEFIKKNPQLSKIHIRKVLTDSNATMDDIQYIASDLQEPDILKGIVSLYRKKGIPDKNILNKILEGNKIPVGNDILENKKENIRALKNVPENIRYLFENVETENVSNFLHTFFDDGELKEFLSSEGLETSFRIARLSRLYNIDPTIISSIDWKLLDKSFEGVNDQKIQVIGKQTREEQKEVTQLDPFKKKLMLKMFERVDSRTSQWNKFYDNIISNFSDSFYEELLEDLKIQAQNGDLIGSKTLENLTFLFGSNVNQGLSDSRERGEEEINNNNIFNITTKKELEHFDEIRQIVCNAVLENPSLDDISIVGEIDKYLRKFKDIETSEDRVKLALLEKFYGIDLDEAKRLSRIFGIESKDIQCRNESEKNTILQLEAIKAICSIDDTETLRKISQLPYFTVTDLNQSVLIDEKMQQIYGDRIKETLTVCSESDRLPDEQYNGKTIKVYDAGTEFAFVLKSITDKATKEVWDSSTKNVEGKSVLRYRTCCSYLTPENLLKEVPSPDVYIAFSSNLEDYSIDSIYDKDEHSPFYGDGIYHQGGGIFRLPESLEMHTENVENINNSGTTGYNEIIVNTMNTDKNGKSTKLEPNYVVYIQNKDVDRDSDPNWKSCLKMADNFGVPVAIIDREKVRKSEKSKIETMSKEISSKIQNFTLTGKEALKFYSKYNHYLKRYGTDSIQKVLQEDELYWVSSVAETELKEEKKMQSKINEEYLKPYQSRSTEIKKSSETLRRNLDNER